MKRFLLALTFIFLCLSALAQTLNPPQWATGYINVAAGTIVTTNITNSLTAPTNLNITAGGAITTWNVRMPSPAFDGQLITIACPYGNVTTLAVTAVAPDTVQSGGPNSCTATPGQAVVYQYFQRLAQWAVLSTGTSPGGSGTMGMVTLNAGTNITFTGGCNSPTAINCTINTPASMGSVAITAGTNITLSGTCTGTASINCTVNTTAAPTASATGGLTAAAGVFSLGGDSGNIAYTSGGSLALGKTANPGSLTLFGTNTGSVKFVPNTGALGSTVVTWPAITGTIGADAFLGVGSGLTSSAGSIILGDSHLTYSLGAAQFTAGSTTVGGDPNLRSGWRFFYTSNETTVSTHNFASDFAIYLPVSNTVGQNVYDLHERAKTTFTSLYITTSNIAAGQRLAFTDQQNCYGMGDCSAIVLGVQFAGGPIAGDEGQNFSPNQYLRQQPFLVKPTISSVPAQTLCNTTTTTSVNGSSTPQTVGVVDATNCAVNNWIVMNVIIPNNTAYTEAVKLTAVDLINNTITGVFQNDWTIGAIVNPFTSIVQGTCPGGGSTCDGTYSAKPLIYVTSGTGTGGTATVTVSGGVASISIVTQGDNYVVGDVLSVAPANMGGITGFSATVGTTCCGPWTVTPATVLNVTSTGSFGEQRVIVNHTQPSYTTGQATSAAPASSGAFTGIGTTWATNMVGGNSLNPGCVTLAADDYTGTTIVLGFSSALQDWYEINAVSSATSLGIYKTSVAGDAAYEGNGQYASFTGAISGVNLTTSSVSGIISAGTTLQGAGITAGTKIVSGSGSAWVVSIFQTVASETMVASMPTNVGFGTGAYTISPCARILKVVGNTQVILNNNPFTWTAGDSIEEIITPYADVHGLQYVIEAYTQGATYRSMMEFDNDGGRTMGVGLTISAPEMQVGGGADTVGWGIGVAVNSANIAFQSTNNPLAMLIVGTDSKICWNNVTCMGPSTAIGGGMQIGGAGTANGQQGTIWTYAPFATTSLNPINNALPTMEFGGNFLSSAISHINSMTTVATAMTIGFDPGTTGPFEAFKFGNGDGIAESVTVSGATQKMLIFSTNGLQLYGDTAGSDPTGSNSSLGTVTIFEGGSEAELAITNTALTNNVTFAATAPGVLTILGNGSGSSNGGIIVGAETVNSFAGVGSRPVCVTSTGVLEVGSLSAGLVTCP